MFGRGDGIMHAGMRLRGCNLFGRYVGRVNFRKVPSERDARLAAAATTIQNEIASRGNAREPLEQFRWIAGSEVRVLARYRGKQFGIRHAAIVTPGGPRSQAPRACLRSGRSPRRPGGPP